MLKKKSRWALCLFLASGSIALRVESWLPCKLGPTWTCSPEWLGPRSSAPSRNTPPSDGPGQPGARTLPCDTHTRTKEKRGAALRVRERVWRRVETSDYMREVVALQPNWRLSQPTTRRGTMNQQRAAADLVGIRQTSKE